MTRRVIIIIRLKHIYNDVPGSFYHFKVDYGGGGQQQSLIFQN